MPSARQLLSSLMPRIIYILAGGGLVWSVLAHGYNGDKLSATDVLRSAPVPGAVSAAGMPGPSTVIESAGRAPLGTYAFAAKALIEYRHGRGRKAESLMQRALSLDPRNTAVRAWLMYLYLEQDRLPQGIDQAAALYKLDRNLHQPLSAMMSTLAQLPDARPLLIARFGTTPQLLQIIEAVPPASLEPSAIMQMLTAVRVEDREAAQARAVEEFFRHNDYEAGYDAWRQFFPHASAPSGLIHDGNFSGLAGSAPFNWTIMSSDTLQAERVRTGITGAATALRLDRFGANIEVAAWQSAVLKAGRYRLLYLLRMEAKNQRLTDAPFAWRISCTDPAMSETTTLPIDAPTSTKWHPRASTLTVSGGCKLTRIELISVGTASNVAARAMITNLSLDPLP